MNNLETNALRIAELKECNYYDKLKALLEALEVQNIEHLLLNGDVETYQIIGEMIAQKCKGFKND